MRAPDERSGLLDDDDTAGSVDWRNNNSVFFDNRTFSSLAEMKSSLLESCCPGDGVLSGALSLITTAATPTMLSVPLAFAVGGWAFAGGCTAFCILITFLSVRILALASSSADSDDYETVASFFLGAKGKWTVRCVLFFYNFGCSIVYLTFIKDSITPVLVGRATFLPTQLRSEVGGVLFLFASMVVIIPLTFNSRLASLRTKGLISNIFTMFIIFSIAYRFFVPSAARIDDAAGPENADEARLTGPFSNAYILAAIPYLFSGPIFLFSYEVQSNIMAVIKDLHDRTGHKILISISLALLVVTFIYTLLGIFGTLTFPHLATGNILAMYDVQNDLLMMTCQLLCCFSAAVSFVFCMFPARLAAFMFVSGSTTSKIPKSMRVRLGVTLSIAAAILAIFLPDVAQMVSVLGALFSATLSMTFPALFAFKMRNAGTYLTSRLDGVIAVLLLVMGIGFSVIGTFMAVVFAG